MENEQAGEIQKLIEEGESNLVSTGAIMKRPLFLEPLKLLLDIISRHSKETSNGLVMSSIKLLMKKFWSSSQNQQLNF